MLIAGVREGRVAGPEVRRGDAVRREPGDVGPPELGPDLEPVAIDERAQERVRRGPAPRPGAQSTTSKESPSDSRPQEGRARAEPLRPRPETDRARTGGSREPTLGRAPRCLRRRPRRAPLAPPRGTRSRRAPDVAPRRPRAVEHGGRGGGSRCDPSTGAPCAPARRRATISARIVPWQPASIAPSVGSPSRATSPATQVGALAEQATSPLCSASTSSAS